MCLLAGGFVKVQWFYKIINDVSSVTLFLKIMCLIISLADYQYIKAKGQFTPQRRGSHTKYATVFQNNSLGINEGRKFRGNPNKEDC